MNETFRLVDVETTGEDPAEHAIIEIACLDLSLEAGVSNVRQTLIDPRRPIPPEASAVHHLIDDDVAGAPDARDIVAAYLMAYPLPHALVAHRASFEEGFIDNYFAGIPWICTYKCALRIWPDAPGFSNQTLRYWLGFAKLDGAMPPHRALPDCIVNAAILRKMLLDASIDELIAWSKEPPLLPRIPFGKHRGSAWSEVPPDYLEWIITKSDLDDDAKWNAGRELRRRHTERFCESAAVAITVDELNRGFADYGRLRAQLGIVKGTAEYDRIVSACATRKAALLAAAAAVSAASPPDGNALAAPQSGGPPS